MYVSYKQMGHNIIFCGEYWQLTVENILKNDYDQMISFRKCMIKVKTIKNRLYLKYEILN